jgi:hypothetical protein
VAPLILSCTLLCAFLTTAPAEPGFTLRSARFEADVVVLTGVPDDPSATGWRVWDGDGELTVRSAGPSTTPCVLVAVVDTSVESGRLLLPVVKAIRAATADEPDLSVGVVAFSSTARCVLEPTVDRELLAEALDGLAATGRGSISSGVGLALGVASSYPRARVVVISDGQDSAGPISSSVTFDAARAAGVPVFGIGVGNRVEMSLLSDLANATAGSAVHVLTPVDVEGELRALVHSLAQEVELRAVCPPRDGLTAHSFRAGLARPAGTPLVATCPTAEGTGELLVPIDVAGGAAEDTIAVLSREGQPVWVVRANRASRAPAGEWQLRLGVAPPGAPAEVRVAPGQRTETPALHLAAVEVGPPETGLPSTTRVWLTQAGERIVEFGLGETVPCRPGAYGVRVGTRPPYDSPAFEAEAGQVRGLTAPGVGELLVDTVGPDGKRLECGVAVRDQSDKVVLSGLSGRVETLTEGLYQVAAAIPPARSVQARIAPGERTVVRLADFGELLLRAPGPDEEELGLRYVVRAPDGTRGLVASGRTGAPLLLGAGTYDVTIESAPELDCAGITIAAGLRREDVIRRFGAVFVRGPATLAYRVFRAGDNAWVGTFQAGRRVVLLEGDYRLVPDIAGVTTGRAVRVDAGTIVTVDLAPDAAEGGT